MSGSRGFGNGRPTRELTGAIRTTTIMSVAGRCMKAIGTTKTMGITMTTVVVMMIAIIADPVCRQKGPSSGPFCWVGQYTTQFVFAAAESSSPAK